MFKTNLFSKNNAQVLDTAIVLLLTGMFVMLSIGIMTLGISIYNHTNQVSLKNYEQRTALSYIANQIRMNDTINCIDIESFYNTSVLTLSQEVDGVIYKTLLYCYDGQLREIFTEEGIVHEPDSGVAIMPLKSLDFEPYGDAVKVSLENPSGGREFLVLYPRSGNLGDYSANKKQVVWRT